MDNGEGEPRPRWVFGYALEWHLREADDPDLWLEAELFAHRVFGAVIAKRSAAHRCDEDGGSRPFGPQG